MADDQFPRETTQSIPAADIKVTGGKQEKITHSYPIVHVNADKQDFVLTIMASVLLRSRNRLRTLQRFAFPWPEILLTIAGASFGAFAGAFSGSIELNSTKGIVFFVFVPMVFVGSTVAYFFTRINPIMAANNIATELLSDLPDPEDVQLKDGEL